MILTASIVTYNHSIEEIQKVINCFKKAPLKCEIYISDNSNNASLSVLADQNENVNYSLNPNNYGFGKGHNSVINRVSNSDIHFIVNPDVSFDGAILQQLGDYLMNNEIGLCSPRAVYPDGEQQIMARMIPSLLDLIIRRFGATLFRSRAIQNELPSKSIRSIECYFLHGFFLACNFNLLKEIGGYDERYFMYMEDLDLIRKISKTHEVHYVPEVMIVHAFERGSAKKFKLLMYHIQSMIKYFNKWGWFVDKERRELNRKVLAQFKK